MAQLSSPRGRGYAWGVRAAATAHVAGRLAKRNRWYRATTTAVGTVFRSVRSVLRVLWLEITGLIFVFFAVTGVSDAWREYHKHGFVSGKLVAGVCFSVLFAWYAVTSFWRTRRM